MATEAVYALYPAPDSAQRAVEQLRASGVPESEIVVISSEPFEDYEFSHRDKRTWMYWIAGAGGLGGLAIGTFLTSYTERAWPLQTGGMPIVAWWPNLVVMFELTMLCAILSTVVTLVVAGGLGRRRSRLYDADIMNDEILVGVAASSSVPPDVVERALRAVDGARLKTI